MWGSPSAQATLVVLDGSLILLILNIGSDIGTTKAFSGHTSTKTLEDHYITPESSAVREAANRAERALLDRQRTAEEAEKRQIRFPQQKKEGGYE
jgi:hypothetical protein